MKQSRVIKSLKVVNKPLPTRSSLTHLIPTMRTLKPGQHISVTIKAPNNMPTLKRNVYAGAASIKKKFKMYSPNPNTLLVGV